MSALAPCSPRVHDGRVRAPSAVASLAVAVAVAVTVAIGVIVAGCAPRAASTPPPATAATASSPFSGVTGDACVVGPRTLSAASTHASKPVLASRREHWTYCRSSLLSVEGTGAPALLGLVRIHLGAIPPDTRDKVLEEKTPLGAILISHDVLRRIEPLAYIEVEATPELAALLGAGAPAPPAWHGPPGGDPAAPGWSAPLYGRLAAIHCAGEAAIDLLEVAAP